jgi:3-deoxy-D-manno-octulosonic acid kinase
MVAGWVESGRTLADIARASEDSRELIGRGTAWDVATPAGRWVIRHYRRGGAVADLLGDRYLRAGAPRPFAELEASEAARARGVPTPEVMAAIAYPAGPFYRADIPTALIPDSADLATLAFDASPPIDVDPAAAWREAGSLIRLAAEAGVRHVDLNLRNILIASTPVGPRAWLLDLDRCRVGEALPAAGRERMIERFHRSRVKLEGLHDRRVGEAELAAFRAGLDG